MEQVVFVLHDGSISQWWLKRGKLLSVTLKGLQRLEFTDKTAKAFWDWWVDDNQVIDDDSFDAIFLSSSKAGFGTLPKCFQKKKDASSWTLESLSLIAKEPDFVGNAIEFAQKKVSRQAIGTKVDGTPIKFSIDSSLAFTLPKEPVKAPEPPKPVEKKPEPPKSTGIIGDSFNDPEALKLSVGAELSGVVEKVLKAMKRNYVRVEGFRDQVCFRASDENDFVVGDELTLTVMKVDEAEKKVLFAVAKA